MIAERLHVGEHAVEQHSNAISSKLALTEGQEVNRRVEAVLVFLAGGDDEAVGGP